MQRGSQHLKSINFSLNAVNSPHQQVLENRGRVAIFIDGSNLFMPRYNWELK